MNILKICQSVAQRILVWNMSTSCCVSAVFLIFTSFDQGQALVYACTGCSVKHLGWWSIEIKPVFFIIHVSLLPLYLTFLHFSLTFSRLMTYVYVIPHRKPPDVAFYIFNSTNIPTEYFKHAAHSPFFPLQKCRLFHNATLFWFLYYSRFKYRVC